MEQNIENVVQSIFELQKKQVSKQRLTTSKERIILLRKLKDALPGILPKLTEALAKDVAKPPFEVQYMELGGLLDVIDQTCAQLEEWMKPEKRASSLDPNAIVEIRSEARGIVLVIGPWNVPFLLTIDPMIAALAAGNCVVLKPSELTPHTSRLIAEFIPTVFPPENVSVVEGGVEITQDLLALPFDHIFFTGSTNVGKIVMTAAAKNLSSVTLELGGKSPCFVDEQANIERVAAALMHKKTMNGGQICVAPDYVLVHKTREQELVAALKKYTDQYFYGDGSFNSSDMSNIINQRNYERLKSLYQDALDKGAQVAFGGIFHDDRIQIEPTVLTNVDSSSKIMQEEIFGPFLPVISYEDVDQAISYVNQNEKPLGLYIFSQNNKYIENIISRTSSGGVTVNEVMMHSFDQSIPFGGVNTSGMGSYHGIYGFRELSHQKSIYYASEGPLDTSMHPPFAKKHSNPSH